jgi:alpha,alpha-trehalase
MMVRLLAEDDDQVLGRYYAALQKEYSFWMAGADKLENGGSYRRVVKMEDGLVLNRYWDNFAEPRPESYKEDVHLAKESGRDAEQLYYDLRAACESGWDFSSRWFRDPMDLGSIHTTEILPVDLNCLLWNLEQTLSEAAKAAGDAKATEYQAAADRRKAAVQSLFWNEAEGYFLDYDYVAKIHKAVPSMAGAFPAFLNLATDPQALGVKNTLEQKLLKAGGFLSTLNNNGQQWDAPNGWAPLQWVGIKGLRNYGYDELANTAKNRWITLNNKVYKNTGKMVEKYNVVDMNLLAGGGEYPVQDGFGWSNGVLLRLIKEN